MAPPPPPPPCAPYDRIHPPKLSLESFLPGLLSLILNPSTSACAELEHCIKLLLSDSQRLSTVFPLSKKHLFWPFGSGRCYRNIGRRVSVLKDHNQKSKISVRIVNAEAALLDKFLPILFVFFRHETHEITLPSSASIKWGGKKKRRKNTLQAAKA